MTRPGCAWSTASMFGRSPSPRSGTSFAESGQLSQWVRPTRRDPAPMAKSISVVDGLSETIRFGGEPRVIAWPKSSRIETVVESAAFRVACLDAEPSHARTRTVHNTTARDDMPGSPLRRPSKVAAKRGRLLAPGSIARLPDLRQWLRERAWSNTRYSGGGPPALRPVSLPPLAPQVLPRIQDRAPPAAGRPTQRPLPPPPRVSQGGRGAPAADVWGAQ